jgi:MFS family permease
MCKYSLPFPTTTLFLLQMPRTDSRDSHLFYLPFYFQASKGTTAEESGIRTIAYLVSLTVGSIIVGVYAPFMWFGSAVFTIGCGMLHTLTVSSSPAQWLGYQVLAGLGCGAAVQIPFIAVQVVASEKDMPTANALVFFFNSLGGAVSLAIAQNVFINGLAENVPKYAPDVDPRVVIGAGATFVRQVVKPESLQGVLEAYTKAITQAFLISVVVGAIAFVASLGMELKSVKGKKIAMGGAA